MPFGRRNNANPAGRPPKGTSLKDLLRKHPIRDKRLLVQKAFELALAGDVRWAEWIARYWADAETAALPEGGGVRRIIIEERWHDAAPDLLASDESAAIVVPLPPAARRDA